MASGAEMGRRPEKSSFSVTCNLLRKYIREKGCPADLGLGIPSRTLSPPAMAKREMYRPPTTMNLLRGIAASGDFFPSIKDDVSAGNPPRSKELHLNHTDFGRSIPAADTKKPDQSQLTIFYGGKVLVFDNFPAEKADDLMQLARKSSSMDAPVQNFSFMPSNLVAAADPKLCPSPVIPPVTYPLRSQPNFSDLPIARKASLHRFLEKRKDRISAKAPYLIWNSSGMMISSASKEGDINSKAWLGTGAHSPN